MLSNSSPDTFPLTKNTIIKGTRRIAREKVLQILNAYFVSDRHWLENFDHIFFREFKFDADDAIGTKILTPDEVTETDADYPIEWAQDEIEYAKELLRSIVRDKDILEDLIKNNSSNWGIERIALIDKILMYIAITELINFPDIPPKVSINEAIEIAKKYSTPKSGNFINGLLDALHLKLKEEGKIQKIGKGLINS